MGRSPHIPLHWAEEEELRERYVLHQLDADLLRRCEEHLEACSSCRSEVASEQELIAGLRLVGRESLKERLSQRVDVPSSHEPTWRMSAAVAAGMAFLLTLAVTTIWILQQQAREPTTGTTEMTQKIDTEADHLEKKTPEAVPEPPSSLYRRKDVASDVTGRKEGEKPERDRGEKKSDETPQLKAPATSSPSAAEINQTIGESAPPLADAQADSQREEEWMIGSVHASLPLGKESQTKASLPPITLRQRPDGKSSTPTGGRFAGGALPGITTLIQKNRDGLTLTLYVDSLFAEPDLQQAHITRVAADSVVIQISGVRLGYRFPTGWLPN